MPMGSVLVPLTIPAGDRGSSLVHFAPMSAKRMSAAGPGRFNATLKIRMPTRVLSEGFKMVNFVALRLSKIQG